jgi:hypothetical protein
VPFDRIEKFKNNTLHFPEIPVVGAYELMSQDAVDIYEKRLRYTGYHMGLGQFPAGIAWHGKCCPRHSGKALCHINFIIENYGKHLERLISQLLIKTFHRALFISAWFTPGGPEINENHFALYTVKIPDFSRCILQHEIRGGFADLHTLHFTPDTNVFKPCEHKQKKSQQQV